MESTSPSTQSAGNSASTLLQAGHDTLQFGIKTVNLPPCPKDPLGLGKFLNKLKIDLKENGWK